MNKKPKLSKKARNKGKKKKKYKVRNWREYNQMLVDRGKAFFYLTEEAIAEWENQKRTGKRGRPQDYSNLAVQTALTLQQVFHLPLRQTEGFLESIFKKLAVSLKAPDHSTLSLRGKALPVEIRVRPLRAEPLHIVVDSTGAKVYGEGEWKVRQHGWSKRRTWKKLHIGVDEKTGDILLGEATGNGTADCQMLKPLLSQLPKETQIDQVSGDGGYDRRRCYQALQEREVAHIAIPPQQNAKIWQHGNARHGPLPRDENLRRIRKIGRTRWKVETHYHRRSIAETTIFRFKTIFTDRVSARTDAGQRMQLLLRCRILNQMTALGMPQTTVVA